MEFEIRKNVMPDPAARQSFDALARQVFGLSFEGWYQSGYWTESNLPYTLLSQETALANVSVNRLEALDRLAAQQKEAAVQQDAFGFLDAVAAGAAAGDEEDR